MSTYTSKPDKIARNWHVIDAEDIILGRLASQVVILSRGRHKPAYTPHVGGGDFVIVVNASKIALTGSKRTGDMRYPHSGHLGNLKAVSIGKLLEKNPHKAVERAAWGMLPRNRLDRRLIGKLKAYPEPEHPRAAQKPQPFEITQIAR